MAKKSLKPPKYLGKLAVEAWKIVVPYLEDLANAELQKIDTFLLEQYCVNYQLYREAYEHIQKHGQVTPIWKTPISPTGEMGEPEFVGYKNNPATRNMNDAVKNLSRLGIDLGMTPKARAELIAVLDANKEDEESIADLINGSGGFD